MSQKIYQPVVFVHSYTIGKQKQEKKQYEWQLKEIVIPKAGYEPVYYYLFHVPPIYNWVKNIPSKEQGILNDYINPVNIITPINQSHKKKDLTASIAFNKQFFMAKLQRFIFQWQIVKICCCCKVYIQSIEDNTNSLLKTHQWVNNYSYNKSKQILECNEIVIFNKIHRGVFIIEQYPFAPLFYRFQGVKISIMKQQYELILVYQENCYYVRAGNKIWYCIFNKAQDRVVGANQLQFKNGIIFVYAKAVKSRNILKICEAPIKKKEKVQQKKLPKNLDQTNTYEITSTIDKIKKNQQKKLKIETIISQPIQQENVELVPLIKNHQQVIPLNGENGNFIKYSNAIQKLFLRPKEKDQYDKDYDKGKVKKIKKKTIYIKPNYNQVYKQVITANKDRANQYNLQQQYQTNNYNKIKVKSFQKNKRIKKDIRNSFKNKYESQN